jgi:hypothetical protein
VGAGGRTEQEGQARGKRRRSSGTSEVGAGRAGTLVLDDLLGQTRVASFTTDDDGAGVARPGYINLKREPTSAPAAGVGRTDTLVLDGLLGQTCVAFATDDDAPAGPASRVRTLSSGKSCPGTGREALVAEEGRAGTKGGGKKPESHWQVEAEGRV